MGINFPASPTVGQKYPQPAVAGIPVYTWDGEKWTTVGGSVAAYAPPSIILPLMDATPAVTGVGTAYAREDHVHPLSTSTDFVKTVPQTLTAPQQQQARQNIYAAPFDAMAYSGLQINGGMEVNQVGVGTNVSGAFPCDGWRLQFAGSMVISSAAVANSIVAGMPYNLGLAPTTAQASLGAGDLTIISQAIEGWRCARLGWGTANAQPITISFWSAHHRTGVYSAAIRNAANNRSYTFTYTHNAADVVQYNTVTVPGDTTGTWAVDNTTGMAVTFAMASGATYTASSANTWLAGNFIAAPGQINGVAATSDAFRITGVIVLPGNEAPPAARSPYIMRPLPQELPLCQRYFFSLPLAGIPYPVIGFTNSAALTTIFPNMRSSPTVTPPPLWADVNYSNGVAPGASNWCFLLGGVAYLSRTGTCSISVQTATPHTVTFLISGMTLSNFADLVQFGTNFTPITIDARI